MKNLITVLICCTLSSCLFENPADDFKWKGRTKFESGDYKGAIEEYNQAIALNPKDPDSYHGRGLAKSNLEDQKGATIDFEKAIDIYDQLIEKTPKNTDFFNSRGVIKSNLGDYIGAIKDFKIALEINPNHEDALNNFMLVSGQLNNGMERFIENKNKTIELKED